MSPNGLAPADVIEVEVKSPTADRIALAIRACKDAEQRFNEANAAMSNLIGLYMELTGVDPKRFLGTRGTEQGGLIIAYRAEPEVIPAPSD